jgi:antitoxin component YwqK of YwqJK toxin-antitoxin module
MIPKIFLFLALVAMPGVLMAQDYEIRNGFAYDKNGELLNGELRTLHSDGSTNMVYTYREGVQQGPFLAYNTEGKLIESGAFFAGLKHGTWTRWNDQGIKTGEIRFKYGQRDGKWQIWNEDGRLRCLMYYKNGARTGNWQMFDDAGDLVLEKTPEAVL